MTTIVEQVRRHPAIDDHAPGLRPFRDQRDVEVIEALHLAHAQAQFVRLVSKQGNAGACERAAKTIDRRGRQCRQPGANHTS